MISPIAMIRNRERENMRSSVCKNNAIKFGVKIINSCGEHIGSVMKFKKGDQVKFLNSVDEGIVLSVRGHQIEVQDEHGFVVEVSDNEIVEKNNGLDELHYSYDSGMDKKRDMDTGNVRNKSDVKLSLKNGGSNKKTLLEIDLHINELIDRTSHLTNFQIVMIQMEHFRKMLNLALENHYQKVIFIHGVGEGVLRSEIRAELKEMPNCEYVDADFSRYGQGATEVNLWYN